MLRLKYLFKLMIFFSLNFVLIYTSTYLPTQSLSDAFPIILIQGPTNKATLAFAEKQEAIGSLSFAKKQEAIDSLSFAEKQEAIDSLYSTKFEKVSETIQPLNNRPAEAANEIKAVPIQPVKEMKAVPIQIANEIKSIPAPTVQSAKEAVSLQTQPAKEIKGDIWEKIAKNLKMDHQVDTVQVQAEMQKLLANKELFNRTLQQAERYIYYIYEEINQYGLPAELAFIPFIESEFNPNDLSRAGAAGLWQLMPRTAKILGVVVQANDDERYRIVESTEAALTHLVDLGKAFNGNWYLAIAAYNCGRARVEAAINKAGTQNIWALPLPQETKLYVPKLLAVTEIIKNADKYGIQLPTTKG